ERMSGNPTTAMRFGLVGYGAFGRLHAQSIAKVADAALVAICARGDEAAAAAAADFPGVAVHRDYRALVQDAAVEVVDVVTPNHTHAEIGVAALEAGKDLLLEKPMATTVEGCDALITAARRSGRLINVGHELRLSSQWGTIKRLIDDGAIGAPRYANLSLFRHPYRQGAGGWRYAADRVGSWILEEPVHFYDLLMWYFEAAGDPRSVRAVGNGCGRDAASGRPGMYDNFTSLLTFSDGRYATITQSLAGFEHHMLLEITGERGALRSRWSGGDARSLAPTFALTLMRGGAAPETLELGRSGEVFELEEQIRRTVEAFRARCTLVSGEVGRKPIVVCLAAERSARESQEVTLGF
ncbi:MAG TPA: Gfo/Idh/MocA family oxidoreductase, partial [Geminicoccaceae bacterium]|nr:Gfo/Idh/MocA family oxidoreductase [Geminicoccaceae bacterium]